MSWDTKVTCDVRAEISARVSRITSGHYISVRIGEGQNYMVLDFHNAGPVHVAKWRELGESILRAVTEAEALAAREAELATVTR